MCAIAEHGGHGFGRRWQQSRKTVRRSCRNCLLLRVRVRAFTSQGEYSVLGNCPVFKPERHSCVPVGSSVEQRPYVMFDAFDSGRRRVELRPDQKTRVPMSPHVIEQHLLPNRLQMRQAF